MADFDSWLPALILFEDFGGDWNRYLEAIYAIFKRDFIDSKPVFSGRRVGLKRHPLTDGKEATFWHFISEGAIERERTPDLSRCERIAWPKPMIEAVLGTSVCTWRTVRGNDKRIIIALKDFSYIVVLVDRGNYVLPWTAYCVQRSHRRRKLYKEYEDFKRAQKC